MKNHHVPSARIPSRGPSPHSDRHVEEAEGQGGDLARGSCYLPDYLRIGCINLFIRSYEMLNRGLELSESTADAQNKEVVRADPGLALD